MPPVTAVDFSSFCAKHWLPIQACTSVPRARARGEITPEMARKPLTNEDKNPNIARPRVPRTVKVGYRRNRIECKEIALANSAQARKRARQNVVRREQNTGRRSMMRTHIKNVLKAVAAEDKDGAKSAYQSAVSIIDRSAKAGLIHKNAAARYKSRLNARVRAI